MAKKKQQRNARRAIQEVTINDVAAQAGVSAMSVSRVLNGRVPVSKATEKRVHEAVAKLNYSPNPAARHLAGVAPRRIGFIFSNPSQAYLSELLVGALEEATVQGLQIALGRAKEPQVRLQEITSLVESGVDAFLLPPSVCDAPDVLQMLRNAGATWVAISPMDADLHPLSVSVDDFDAARRMTAQLVKRGHQCIGFIIGDPSFRAAVDRHRGYLSALSDAGLEPGPVEQGYFSFQSGLDAAERLLARTPRCTAIFASNDDMAAAVISVAHRDNLEVPGDLSVVGFDDTPISSIISPSITTVRQPIAQMAQAAIRMLAQASNGRLQDREPTQPQQQFHCLLLERQSSGPPGSLRISKRNKNKRTVR